MSECSDDSELSDSTLEEILNGIHCFHAPGSYTHCETENLETGDSSNTKDDTDSDDGRFQFKSKDVNFLLGGRVSPQSDDLQTLENISDDFGKQITSSSKESHGLYPPIIQEYLRENHKHVFDRLTEMDTTNVEVIYGGLSLLVTLNIKGEVPVTLLYDFVVFSKSQPLLVLSVVSDKTEESIEYNSSLARNIVSNIRKHSLDNLSLTNGVIKENQCKTKSDFVSAVESIGRESSLFAIPSNLSMTPSRCKKALCGFVHRIATAHMLTQTFQKKSEIYYLTLEEAMVLTKIIDQRCTCKVEIDDCNTSVPTLMGEIALRLCQAGKTSVTLTEDDEIQDYRTVNITQKREGMATRAIASQWTGSSEWLFLHKQGQKSSHSIASGTLVEDMKGSNFGMTVEEIPPKQRKGCFGRLFRRIWMKISLPHGPKQEPQHGNKRRRLRKMSSGQLKMHLKERNYKEVTSEELLSTSVSPLDTSGMTEAEIYERKIKADQSCPGQSIPQPVEYRNDRNREENYDVQKEISHLLSPPIQVPEILVEVHKNDELRTEDNGSDTSKEAKESRSWSNASSGYHSAPEIDNTLTAFKIQDEERY